MASYTYLNGDYSKLKTVLQNSGFFDSVETGEFTVDSLSYTNGVICGTTEKPGFLKVGQRWDSGSNVNQYAVAVNQGGNPSYVFIPGTVSGQSADYFPVGVYVAEGGVSIVCARARILITRNQLGKVVVITGANPAKADSSADYIMSKISAIAETDDVPFNAHTINTSPGYQTYVMPICTMSSELSYTDKAGLLAYKQTTAVQNIQYNGKCYFSDGYFAIEDGEE